MRFALAALGLMLAATLAGCTSTTDTSSTTSAAASGPQHTTVLIHTSAGDMTVELYDDKAPATVANFLTYVREAFYTNLHCYRIEPGFVNQCGGEADSKKPGHPGIADEAKASGLKNLKYTIAMARTNDPNSAQTEFFINAADNCFLDPPTVSSCPSKVVSPDGYAVFGIVTAGRDISDKINTMKAAPPALLSITVGASVAAGNPAPPPPPPPPAPPAPPCPNMAAKTHTPLAGAIDLDLIVPESWNVCADKDYMFVWIHNNGTAQVSYNWTVTGKGGAPLPKDWVVTFQAASGALKAAGTKVASSNSPSGYDYVDWAGTLATLTIPSSQQAADVAAELHAAGATRAFTVHVEGARGQVTTVGQSVDTHYDLKGQDGKKIQEGPFCLTAGGQEAVKGYSFGVVGLAVGEKVTLIVPPPFAYGYGGSSPLAGQWLTWATDIVDKVPACQG